MGTEAEGEGGRHLRQLAPLRCPPLTGGWTWWGDGAEATGSTWLADQNVVECSCSWNWEERMGEREGRRDEAWQPQRGMSLA